MKVVQILTSSPRRILLWILWAAIHAMAFTFGYFMQKNDHTLDNLNIIGPSVYISRGAALVLIMDTAIILLPMCRTFLVRSAPILSARLGIPLGHPSAFHKVIAWTMLFFVLLHLGGHIVNFYVLQKLGLDNALTLHFKTPAGITGYLMIIIIILMFTTAQKSVRRSHHEVFVNTHQLSMIFIILLLLHPIGCFVKTVEGQCKGYLSYRYILPGYLLYLLERAARTYRASRNTTVVEAITHPGGVIEIRLDAPGFTYASGQHAYVKFPLISRYQWHPFSITSAPHEKYVTFHIHRAGNWTDSLATLFANEFRRDSKTGFDKPVLPMSISLDGPSGTLTSSIFDQDVAILVGGGIGVTPCASVLKEIFWRHKHFTTGRLRRVEFFWICRSMDSFEWFRNDVIHILEQGCDSFLRVHCHLTGKNAPLPTDDLEKGELSDAKIPPNLDPILKTKRGRPNFEQVFNEVASEELQDVGDRWKRLPKVKIGVYVCGPRALRQGIRRDASRNTVNGSEFSVFW